LAIYNITKRCYGAAALRFYSGEILDLPKSEQVHPKILFKHQIKDNIIVTHHSQNT